MQAFIDRSHGLLFASTYVSMNSVAYAENFGASLAKVVPIRPSCCRQRDEDGSCSPDSTAAAAATTASERPVRNRRRRSQRGPFA